jgi:hypothetical protein
MNVLLGMGTPCLYSRLGNNIQKIAGQNHRAQNVTGQHSNTEARILQSRFRHFCGTE